MCVWGGGSKVVGIKVVLSIDFFSISTSEPKI